MVYFQKLSIRLLLLLDFRVVLGQRKREDMKKRFFCNTNRIEELVKLIKSKIQDFKEKHPLLFKITIFVIKSCLFHLSEILSSKIAIAITVALGGPIGFIVGVVMGMIIERFIKCFVNKTINKVFYSI